MYFFGLGTLLLRKASAECVSAPKSTAGACRLFPDFRTVFSIHTPRCIKYQGGRVCGRYTILGGNVRSIRSSYLYPSALSIAAQRGTFSFFFPIPFIIFALRFRYEMTGTTIPVFSSPFRTSVGSATCNIPCTFNSTQAMLPKKKK